MGFFAVRAVVKGIIEEDEEVEAAIDETKTRIVKDNWLTTIFNNQDLLNVEYTDDGKSIIFNFKDGTKLIIAVSWYNSLDVSYH